MPTTIAAYTDLRSPYTFVAKAEAYAWEDELDVVLDWYPFTTPLGEVFGTPAERDPSALNKVKYFYKHVRRLAEPQGLTIYGTRKIYDPTAGHVGLLQAKHDGVLRAYHDLGHVRVFDRSFDPDDRAQVRALLSEAGGDADAYDALLDGDGPARLARIDQAAIAQGVFGVPSFIHQGEIFFGNDAMPYLRRRLESAA